MEDGFSMTVMMYAPVEKRGLADYSAQLSNAHVERYAYVGSDWHVLDRTAGDDLAHDATQRMPRSIGNGRGMSLLKEEQL